MIDLILIRHAKAEDGHGRPDHERALNDKGSRTADWMASKVAARTPRPQRLFCSTALRTRQTAAPLVERWNLKPDEFVLDDTLYLASPDRILELLQVEGGDAMTLCVIGHNPGISEVAVRLSGDAELADLPTFGVVHLRADVPTTAALTPGCAERVQRLLPRDFR